MAATQVGQFRDVVVFSGATPKYEDLSESHRGDLRKNTKRQNFSIDDYQAGIHFHSGYSESPSGPSSPRHHHTFEQVRFVLGGQVEYAGKRYGAGWIGYFPEGVYYGPQAQLGPGRGIVLQFPGPSNCRFHTREEVRRAQKEMHAMGCKFEDGMVFWPDGRKQDGADAMHSYIDDGVPLEYPAPRFDEQVWMNTENYPWQESSVPGVAVKRLAFFNARGPAVQLLRLDAGASIPAGRTSAMMMRWIYEGDAEYKGERLPAVSNLYYPPDTQYEALHSPLGATVLSLELQAPGSEAPLPYRI